MDNAMIDKAIMESMARIMENALEMQKPTKFEKFQEEHPYLISLVWLFVQCIGLGVSFLLLSAKNGADEVYKGFAEMVMYIL